MLLLLEEKSQRRASTRKVAQTARSSPGYPSRVCQSGTFTRDFTSFKLNQPTLPIRPIFERPVQDPLHGSLLVHSLSRIPADQADPSKKFSALRFREIASIQRGFYYQKLILSSRGRRQRKQRNTKLVPHTNEPDYRKCRNNSSKSGKVYHLASLDQQNLRIGAFLDSETSRSLQCIPRNHSQCVLLRHPSG